MARTYYTLCKFDTEHGAYFDQFGDYSRAAVQEELETERDAGTRKAHLVIIKTDGTAGALIAALAKLNHTDAVQ